MPGVCRTAAGFGILFLSAALAAPGPADAGRAKAEKTIERALAAHGGIEKLRASRSGILQGTIHAVSPAGSRVSLTFLLLLEGKKIRIEQGGPEPTSIIAYDGRSFHYALNGKPAPFPDTARKTFERAIRADLLLQESAGLPVVHSGSKEVEGEAVELVEFRHPDGEKTILGFHGDSGLLTYIAYSAPHPQKGTRALFEQIRTGYRELGGILTPARIRDRIDGVEVATTEILQADYSAKIPDDVFASSAPR